MKTKTEIETGRKRDQKKERKIETGEGRGERRKIGKGNISRLACRRTFLYRYFSNTVELNFDTCLQTGHRCTGRPIFSAYFPTLFSIVLDKI